METLYKWRVQERDKRGRMRWRIVRSPMTEETARFWAANNNRIIERIATPGALKGTARPAPGIRDEGGGMRALKDTFHLMRDEEEDLALTIMCCIAISHSCTADFLDS